MALQDTTGRVQVVRKVLEAPARRWVRWPLFLPVVIDSVLQNIHDESPSLLYSAADSKRPLATSSSKQLWLPIQPLAAILDG